MIFAGRPRGRNTFDGFTSRWTMPCSCAWPSPASSCSTTGSVARGSGRMPLRSPAGGRRREQLQRHERRALVLPELVDDDDVRVVEAGRGVRLADEADPRVGVGEALRHDLERDLAVEHVVAAQVDRARRALAQLPEENLVVADALGDAHGGDDILADRARGGATRRGSVGPRGGRGDGPDRPELVVLLGVAVGDGEPDAESLADKVLNLRVFPDDAGQMNRSVLDVSGGLLVVSQFTLLGDARRGRRPSYIEAAPPRGGGPPLPALRLPPAAVGPRGGDRRLPRDDGRRPREPGPGHDPPRLAKALLRIATARRWLPERGTGVWCRRGGASPGVRRCVSARARLRRTRGRAGRRCRRTGGRAGLRPSPSRRGGRGLPEDGGGGQDGGQSPSA